MNNKNLNVCSNGKTVVEQVMLYKQMQELGATKDVLNDIFKPIKNYYDNFKEQWYKQVEEKIDRITFSCDFDYKLIRAIETFDIKHAKNIARKNGYSLKGMFNRWFFAILVNWIKNIKSEYLRAKKRPSVQCPICGNYVIRIDELHLKHLRTIRNLPSVLRYENKIYNVYLKPKTSAVCWGKYSETKFYDLLSGKTEAYSKTSVKWIWNENGKKKVLCPFTNKLIDCINNDYLQSLPLEYKHYAEPISWEEFCKHYPKTIVYADILSLDTQNEDDDEVSLMQQVPIEEKFISIDIDNLEDLDVAPNLAYQDVFDIIDKHTSSIDDRRILKLISMGASVEEISRLLNLSYFQVKSRVRTIREKYPELKQDLLVH